MFASEAKPTDPIPIIEDLMVAGEHLTELTDWDVNSDTDRKILSEMMDVYRERLWTRMSSWLQVRAATLLFLKGQLKASLWHGSPVSDETNVLVNDLHHINALGFLTTQGQPGKEECNSSPVYWPKVKKYGMTMQREYVDGLYPKANLSSFITDLVKAGLAVWVKYYDEDDKSTLKIYASTKHFPDMKYTTGREHEYEIHPGSVRYPVKLSRSKGPADEESKVTDMPWETETAIFGQDNSIETMETLEAECQKGLARWVRKNMAELFIIASKFCKTGMLASILEAVKLARPELSKHAQFVALNV